MFEFIIRKYQRKRLRAILQRPRDKRIDNWEEIKTIGLIFTVGNSERWSLIHRFITAQEKNGKEVYLIGFHPDGYEIDYIFSHTGTTICHEREDFSRLGLPKEGVVDNFTGRHYDLIIDTTEEGDFFGEYITAVCDANLKVCYQNENEESYGEMYDMAIKGEGPMDFKDYIEQIVKYLTMIKK